MKWIQNLWNWLHIRTWCYVPYYTVSYIFVYILLLVAAKVVSRLIAYKIHTLHTFASMQAKHSWNHVHKQVRMPTPMNTCSIYLSTKSQIFGCDLKVGDHNHRFYFMPWSIWLTYCHASLMTKVAAECQLRNKMFLRWDPDSYFILTCILLVWPSTVTQLNAAKSALSYLYLVRHLEPAHNSRMDTNISTKHANGNKAKKYFNTVRGHRVGGKDQIKPKWGNLCTMIKINCTPIGL